jgi:hypothetical protein
LNECFRSHKHDRFSIFRFENFFNSIFWSVVSLFDDFFCNVANASWIVSFVINVRAIRRWFRNSSKRSFIDVENFFLIHLMIENRLSCEHKWQIHRSQWIQKILCSSIVLHIRQIQSFCLRINLLSVQQSLIHLLMFKSFLQIFVFANHLEFSNSIRRRETFLQSW